MSNRVWGTGVWGIWATGGMGYKGYGQWVTWAIGYRGMGHTRSHVLLDPWPVMS